MSFKLLNYYTTQILSSKCCIIECISRLIKVISENNVYIFSAAKFTDPLKSMGSMDPSLRTTDLGDKSTDIYIYIYILLDCRWIG